MAVLRRGKWNVVVEGKFLMLMGVPLLINIVLQLSELPSPQRTAMGAAAGADIEIFALTSAVTTSDSISHALTVRFYTPDAFCRVKLSRSGS